MAAGSTVFIPLSGFLGAGKTTLMLAAAERLRAKGLTVACITNDQGDQLVDSRMVESSGGGFPLGQVKGGCFCCKFHELADTIHIIIASHRPDVILAEAVGSCTDLTATVIRPLRAHHGDEVRVMPLTTVIDPQRFDEMLFGPAAEGVTGFSPEIGYLFRKQLEEASCLLLNKSDSLPEERFERLLCLLRLEFPDACVLTASSIHGDGVEEWLSHVWRGADTTGDQSELDRSALDIDYDMYAAGEAQLGWLNASFTAEGPINDAVHLCRAFASRLADRIKAAGAEIAHVKLWAQDEQRHLKMSVVRSGGMIHADMQPDSLWQTSRITVWINARVHIDAAMLQDQVLLALEWLRSEAYLDVTVQELACFAPSRPVPVYRMV